MDERRSLCFLWMFTALGTGCLLASCATKYWQENKDLNIHFGLWQYCKASDCSDVEIYSKENGTYIDF